MGEELSCARTRLQKLFMLSRLHDLSTPHDYYDLQVWGYCKYRQKVTSARVISAPTIVFDLATVLSLCATITLVLFACHSALMCVKGCMVDCRTIHHKTVESLLYCNF